MSSGRHIAGATTRRNYNAVAWMYSTTSRLYSRGQIGASKAWQIDHLAPGDRVLYAGAGIGEDAELAAAAGARVTCVDIAPKMLQRAEQRLEAKGLSAEFICDDVTKLDAPGAFDAVAANYFLDVFEEDVMVRVMNHLISLLRPGGKLMIADWMPNRGDGVRLAAQRLYRFVANSSYWALGLAPLGSIYEYPDVLRSAGLQIAAIEEFSLTRRGPQCFWSMVAIRQG